jgi:transaldolase
MKTGYFHRVAAQTPTRLWINNVSRDEAQMAIDAGATGCTQNPSYVWKMLTHPTEGAYAKKLLQEILKETKDANEAECILQRQLIAGVGKVFLPLYEKSHGREGYVSIQGDPVHEDDANVIIKEGRENRVMGPNIMIKIPATHAGLIAMEVLLEENTPINITEVMGVNQATAVMDIYDRVTKKTGKYPVAYISHIAGIYDEYLETWVKENKIDIQPDYLAQAGLAVARKVYYMMKDRRSKMDFIGGGIRGLHHFTEMVGGDVCLTINWKGTADILIAQNPPVISRIHNPVSPQVVDALLEKVSEFKRGYMENGLEIHEFEEFGPVHLFRTMFLSAWNSAIDFINTEIKATEASQKTLQPR